MEKLRKFEIIFDNPSAIYFAGKTISGKVIIILTRPMEIRGVEIQFSGSAKVNWKETKNKSNDVNSQHIKEYSASQRYVDHQIQLKETETLRAGEHRFPFTYTLPTHVPSSFEGSHGNVQYFSKATIHCPTELATVCQAPFTVFSSFDLNQETTAREPISDCEKKTFCCFCCVSRSISLTAAMDRTGYVPGESIIINAEINNFSDKKISQTKAVLRSIITYHVAKKTIKETKDITEVARGPIEAGQSDVWNAEPLLIPPIPPSDLSGCKIIDICYYIVFSAIISLPALELNVTLPVLIGTIPLQNNLGNFQPPSATRSSGTTYRPSAPPLPSYPEGPPPPYEESVFGQSSFRNHEDSERLNYSRPYNFSKKSNF